MARDYCVNGVNMTLANQAVTLIWINPGVTAALEILRAWVSQSGTTTSAQIRAQMNTQVTAFPTVVSATPAKLRSDDPASLIVGGTTGAAGTCGINASAEGAGAKTVIIPDVFNNLNGWLWVSTPDDRIFLPASAAAGFGLHLPAAPATLTGWNAGVIFRER